MEPGTPQPTFEIDGADVALAWNKRSEALLSKHGHNVMSLLQALRKRRTGFYALCLGLYAAVPPSRTPETPEEAGEWLADEDAQVSASEALLKLWRNFYPSAAQKKSASKP
jgi:hypothetical protein